MTTKTQLIVELDRAPIKFLGKRADRISMPPAEIVESSEVGETGYSEREIYRFEAKFGAMFHRLPSEAEVARLPRYRELLRSVTEGVYGEVRSEARKLFPLLADIDNRDLRESIESVAGAILEMTEIDP